LQLASLIVESNSQKYALNTQSCLDGLTSLFMHVTRPLTVTILQARQPNSIFFKILWANIISDGRSGNSIASMEIKIVSLWYDIWKKNVMYVTCNKYYTLCHQYTFQYNFHNLTLHYRAQRNRLALLNWESRLQNSGTFQNIHIIFYHCSWL